ncbi:MAG: UDP-N-acetylmuramoylalanyl-D-glutamate--2,6-diaminopimelate ligase [Pseudopedobacter saltans]|uniref:UDP-N-acetylmuramoyl-tripeptide--D-alanyl-D-alanine ligase n=1 Tax=Pseudopedobacter saltans TaxID=151895 RepID=A0A2W5F3N2_9SPHI|nr:MAG: UDP-N-acetylmuramoylalanyl-D-glutamate--2,6-diaminopimelate ligase [Pseudopedobacter saltans]
MNIEALYKIYLQYPLVGTDTRKIEKDSIFFALKGPSFNGNEFALKALEAGAAYAVIDESPSESNDRLILVDNVLKTLHDLAKVHRESFQIPFIGITGSNGKTTTKELVHAVLSQQYKTYFTQGNLNNHIGIPLTILRVKPDAEIAIIEMGANHQKEIEGYCKYAEPTFGIITNCGKAHLEGFGGIEGVRKGKGELYDYIRSNNGSIFAFDDYDYLHDMSKGISTIHWYGTHNGEIIGKETANDPFLKVEITTGFEKSFFIDTQLVGSYNLPNILCAVAIGKTFNVPLEKIQYAISSYAPSNSRSQLIQSEKNKIILDAYNANPTSMAAAIDNFAGLASDKKVLMLGAMMELGDASIEEHKNILNLIKKYNWDKVVLVGGDFGRIDVAPYLYFPDSNAAREWFKQQGFENAEILIKGSNSMHMNRILD